MDEKRRRENLYFSLVSISLSILITAFHLICVYYVWHDHGTMSAGVSLILPWLAEVYWSYYDFSWLYMSFVIIGGLMILVKKFINLGLEQDQ